MKTGELQLVVAGHTNTGKTSLLRTLARDAAFGEVSASPSTTRQVQALHLVDRIGLRITVYDTPGLERAAALREHLDAQPHERHQPRARLAAFVDHHEPAFEQEARVLERALACDAVLYVIDAREPVLEKYLDELYLLGQAGRPLVPLLNFVASPASREAQWRARLAELGLHIVVAFDAVVYDWQAERQLYEDLRRLLPAAAPTLDSLITLRGESRDWRLQTALHLLADALVGLAASSEWVVADDAEAAAGADERLREQARATERALVAALLQVYQYAPDLVTPPAALDAEAGQWRDDLFSPPALRAYGIRASGPVAAGAAAGAALDVAALGGTLGAGTVLGALGGAALGARHVIGRHWQRQMHGRERRQLGEAVLRLLASRNLHLIRSLERRGHAATAALAPVDDAQPLWPGLLPAPLRLARTRPAWAADEDAARRRAVQALVAELQAQAQ